MTEFSVKDLRTHLLKVGEWNKAPRKAWEIVQALDDEYGGDIAIGNHPLIGFFVLHNQGEGAVLVWKEKNNDLEL